MRSTHSSFENSSNPLPDVEIDLDTLPCGVLRTLDDGTICRANRTFARWVSLTPELLVGRRFQELLTMGGKIFHHTHWSPLLRMQGSISEVKLEVVAGGEVIPMVINAIRHDDGAGTIVHDITAYVARDRDRYEQELLRSRARLEGLIAELEQMHEASNDRAAFAEQMMGIVSHDLRNPLNAIQLGADLLAVQGLDEPQQRVVHRIASSTKRAAALIDDLLDFTSARVGSGISVAIAPIQLHELIAECLDELRMVYPNRTLVHRRAGTSETNGDARRLVQLVGNLISNAVVYGAPDTPITVTTSVQGISSITAHNHGSKIPDALRASMFDPMTRGTEAGAPRSVGLGLFIVREIARAHGGAATVTSSDEGTIFRIEWPARAER